MLLLLYGSEGNENRFCDKERSGCCSEGGSVGKVLDASVGGVNVGAGMVVVVDDADPNDDPTVTAEPAQVNGRY